MARLIYFITHPDVVVDPSIPVARWPLSERGRERMRSLLSRSWVAELAAIYSSSEQKAVDGAAMLAEHCRLPFRALPLLGENDRTSTGFLAAAKFQAVADEFFARPETSVRGWERAVDAQARIVSAVLGLAESTPGSGAIAVVAHGAVGALLLCHVKKAAISRSLEQPGKTGGNYFVFRHPPAALVETWTPIENAAAG